MALAQECRTFLDVGANIGVYALFATLLPHIEKCIAFEPNPETANELRKNIARNSARIEIMEAAVSERAGEATFGVVSDYAGNNAVVTTAMRDQFTRRITVPTITLDSISDLPEPICLKIDVEGHEREAIAGAASLLERSCVLQVEDFESSIQALLPRGYSKLTNIGPDHYFTNIEGLSALDAYERAARDLIASNHEAAWGARQGGISVRRGDFTFQVGGRSAARLRKARGLLGRIGQ